MYNLFEISEDEVLLNTVMNLIHLETSTESSPIKFDKNFTSNKSESLSLKNVLND